MEAFRYPSGSEGEVNKDGVFMHGLSTASSIRLEELQKWVLANKIDIFKLSPHSLHSELTLLRFLRANKFDVKKTQSHITTTLTWRAQAGIDSLIVNSPDTILGCKMEELMPLYPHWHVGYDIGHRPVIYKQYGPFMAGAIKRLTGNSFDNMLRYHIWEQEVSAILCKKQSLKFNCIVETITGVIDLKNMTMSQVTSNFLSVVKLLAEVDQKRYPETLGRIFIINAPSSFSSVWGMVKGWIDPVTRDRIQVLKGAADYEPVLKTHIGVDNLPADYGGTQPALSLEIHPYDEYMCSLIPESASATTGDDTCAAESATAALELESQSVTAETAVVAAHHPHHHQTQHIVLHVDPVAVAKFAAHNDDRSLSPIVTPLRHVHGGGGGEAAAAEEDDVVLDPSSASPQQQKQSPGDSNSSISSSTALNVPAEEDDTPIAIDPHSLEQAMAETLLDDDNTAVTIDGDHAKGEEES